MFVFHHFQHILRPQKKFEIIKFERLLCLPTVEKFFSYSFAVVYNAELLISLNDYTSLVTWQMPLSLAVLLTRNPLKLFCVPLVYLIYFHTQH